MTGTDRLPRGWPRFGARLPILVYRVRLGALLGSRFLYLIHQGRRTRRRHETVLVVRHHWVPPEVVVVAAAVVVFDPWVNPPDGPAPSSRRPPAGP